MFSFNSIPLQWNRLSLTEKSRTSWWWKLEIQPGSISTFRLSGISISKEQLVNNSYTLLQQYVSPHFDCWQACPVPNIKWLKDGHTVAKHVSVNNTDTSSQLMIPSPEREDTGIYTILVKNLVGQESSSVEIRVTGNKVNIKVCLFSKIRLSHQGKLLDINTLSSFAH